MYSYILFMVEYGNIHYLTFAPNRESAKRNAHHWIGANMDEYIVTPLTEEGDRVHVGVTLYA